MLITRPHLRKALVTAHIIVSIGWLGAVVVFLALAVAGVTSRDAQVVRAAYLSMQLIGRYVLVPLSLASLLTGLALSLGTKWGLIRHYWVAAKLVMNGVAVFALLWYVQTLGHLADLAAATPPSDGDLGTLFPVIHAGAALSLLVVSVTLSVFKPRGLTRYGRRRHHERRAVSRGRRSDD